MLIFDVGMNDGTDSAYYLRRGHNVVGIDANPQLTESATRRFASEIAQGRFTALNVGIADEQGEIDFWICDDWSAWSSFDRSIASRNGSKHHAISVEIRPMPEILEEHGVPYYCKVDIEGYDQHCLTGLTDESRPPFFSVEHSDYPFIDHMHELGYDRFKLIHQLSFSPPAPRWYRARSVVPSEKLRAGLERARGVLRGSVNDRRWYFKVGSSGPLPWDTPGPWLSYERITELRSWVRAQYDEGSFGLLDCFDLHATSADALEKTAHRR